MGGIEGPLGSPLAGHLSRRPFRHFASEDPNDAAHEKEETLASQSADDVAHAAETAAQAAAKTAVLLQPFYSAIAGGLVSWQEDADVGLVLERRTVVTAVGSGRKVVTAVRKIWPWSPAFSSGALVFGDIVVSVDGVAVDALELSDVRAMLRGEEGSTVIVETLHLGQLHMYTCLCVCVCVCININVCVSLSLSTHTHTHTHTNVNEHMHANTRTYLFKCKCIYARL